jgi:simple sugar transport system substrate-binding protein
LTEEKKMSRPDTLKTLRSFVAGAVVAGAIAGAYEVSKPPAPPPSAPVTSTATVTQMSTVTQAVTASPTAAAPQYTFYYVTHAPPTGVFWGVQKKGLDDVCASLNIKGVYAGPKVPNDLAEELSILQSTIARKPDGILVTVPDAATLEAPLRQAISAGIPVVASNQVDPRPADKRIPYLLYVGNNDYQGGAYEANEALKYYKGKFGRVPVRALFVNHGPAVNCNKARQTAFKDTLIPAGVKTVDSIPTTLDATKSSEDIRAYLTAHPDTEYIGTSHASTQVWAADVVAELGMQDKTVVTGTDVSDVNLDYIQKGKIICTIDQQPYLQAWFGMTCLYLYKKAKFIPLDIYTGPYVVNKDRAANLVSLGKAGYMYGIGREGYR